MNGFKLFSLLAAALLVSACVHKKEPIQDSELIFNPLRATIMDLQKGLAEGTLSVRQITEVYLNRIAAYNHQGPHLNAIISVNPQALQIADSLDEALEKGLKLGALHGIPVILKDNIESLDSMPTTAGSRALAHNFVNRDSKVAAKLRAAGALILAKANLSEWANFRGEHSISGWSAMGGFTRNPHVLSRNPCGSSSGSAVAVAAGLAPIAIGTETNGSIICPSQTNGVVGLKPTVGLISSQGIIPISRSQDAAGPITKTVREAAIVLAVLADPDTTNPANLNFWPPQAWSFHLDTNKTDLKGLRLGVLTKPLGRDFRVDSLFRKSQSELENLGAETIEVKQILPSGTNYASYQVMLYEYNRDLNAYFASLPQDFPIKSITDLIAFNQRDSIELNYFQQQYLKEAVTRDSAFIEVYKENLASMHRFSRSQGMDAIMDSLNLDAIIAPSGSPAWLTDPINGDHFILSSSSPAAISGYPNLSIPMGQIDHLPLGLSIFGRALSEQKLLQIAFAFEQIRDRRIVPQFLEIDKALKN